MAKLPDPWPSLVARIRKIEEELRRKDSTSAFSGSGMEVVDQGQMTQGGSVTIPDNGALLVDGGDVIMLDKAPSATELFKLGTQLLGDRGVTISRDDGSPAFQIRRAFSASDPAQVVAISDRSGNAIFTDATLSPNGLDVPHLEMRFIPVDYTSAALAQTTSSATFMATHEHRGYRQNPGLKPQLMVRCSDGTTAAEIQFFDVAAGAYLGGYFGTPAVHTITVPAGTTTFTLFELASGSLQIPGVMSDPIYLQIHARVTVGTGSVSVAPVRTVGGSL